MNSQGIKMKNTGFNKPDIDIPPPPKRKAYKKLKFEDLPIKILEYEQNGEWHRSYRRKGTIAELLDIWDIDDLSDDSEMAQVLRYLRHYVKLANEKL